MLAQNKQDAGERRFLRLSVGRVALLIAALAILAAVALALINHQMTRPHEKGPNQTLIVGPNNDLEVRTEGCFLRDQTWPTLHFKADGFAPRIIFTPRNAEQKTLRLVMDDVSPDMLTVEGATVLEKLPAQKRMVVETSTAPSKLKVVEWKLSGVQPDFSFFVFGDPHNQYQVLEEIRRDAAREHPLFAVIVGDLGSKGTSEELLKHEAFADSFPAPYFSVLGNHDLKEGTRTAKSYHQIFGPTYYSFWYGSNFFVILDDSNGYISLTQMRWLNDELKNSHNAKETFVFAHQLPFDPRRGHHHAMKPVIGGAALLMHILETGGADYFITGHIHTYYEFQRNGIRYLITGNAKGGGMEPMPISHYTVFKVSGDKVEHFLRIVGNGKSNLE